MIHCLSEYQIELGVTCFYLLTQTILQVLSQVQEDNFEICSFKVYHFKTELITIIFVKYPLMPPGRFKFLFSTHVSLMFPHTGACISASTIYLYISHILTYESRDLFSSTSKYQNLASCLTD